MPSLTRRVLLTTTAAVTVTSAVVACSLRTDPSPLDPIPLDEGEVTNSGRGQLLWLNQPADPAQWPLVDTYLRPDGAWRTIEQKPGRYDWRLLDDALQQAERKGGRLLWRIMPWYSPGMPAEAPAWIPTRTIRPKKGQAFQCPDWDHPQYLESWINLTSALAAHADSNPRLWAVDISGFGAWGEHYWDSDVWGHGMVPANFERIARATRDAFPNTWVLGPAMEPGFSVMPRVFGRDGRWGTRYDYLGGQDLSYEDLPDYRDLWKTGPVVSEWGSSRNVRMQKGLENVRSLHVSLLSSGNKPVAYEALSSPEQRAFLLANKIAGYRYSLDDIRRPDRWKAGEHVTFETTWTNHGVAPTYDPWRIELMIQGKPVTLPGDLRRVLPGTQTLTHRFVAPRGTGALRLRIVDPTGILPPMALATRGRQEDGSYPLP